MEHINKLNFNAPQYGNPVNILFGDPIGISFSRASSDRLDNISILNNSNTSSSVKYTKIHACMNTTKATIHSWFVAKSDADEKNCNVSIESNYSVADLNGKLMFFSSLLAETEETETSEQQLTNTLDQFHQWLFSQIAVQLNQNKFFSLLHSLTAINKLVLNAPPRFSFSF